MPRKKTTPNETDTPAEASTPARSLAKRVRKPRSAATAPSGKAAPRKRAKAAGGNSPTRAAGNSHLQPNSTGQVPVSTVDVIPPPSEWILEDAISEHEQIAQLAYEFWQARGCQGGSSEEDWLRAEQEYRRRRQAQSNGQ